MSLNIVPSTLHDSDEFIVAVRADQPGDTRGKAQALIAMDRGVDFTDISVRRAWVRHDEEGTEDYPVVFCDRRAEGAVPFWMVVN